MSVRKLPHWSITDKFPAFYDTESATAIEMVAKLYGSMEEVITDYNKFVDDTNKIIEDFEKGIITDFDTFKLGMSQQFQDFIDVVELKLGAQDKEIEEAVNYMKTSIEPTITKLIADMKDSGELDATVLQAIDDVNERVNEVNSNLDKKQNYLSIGAFTGNIDMVTFDGSDNTLPQNSIAWVHNTEATGNHPSEYYVLETFVAMTGNIIQKATQYIYQGTPIIHTRMYVNEEWTEWGNSSSFGIAEIEFNSYTEAGNRLVYKVGNKVFFSLCTKGTMLNTETTIFTLPSGFRPKNNTGFWVKAKRVNDSVEGIYYFGIQVDGTITESFNNDGSYWDLEGFVVFETN